MDLFWVAVATQLLGLLSLVSIRLSQHAPVFARLQPLFFLALLAVGTVTVAAFASNSMTWFSSAATLSIMSVGATLDLTGEVSA